jgi:two-component system cell cycle response regulator
MHKKVTFALTLLGLTDSECRVVKSLCTLSRNRSRSYNVLPPSDENQADVWIVDGKDNAAVGALHAARAKKRIPAIVVDGIQSSQHHESHIGRPIVASRLMGALDLLVTKELDYFPELVIGAGATPQSSYADERLSGALHSTSYSKRHTALVLDDSVTILKQVELALRLHDIEATCVDNADSAMDLLEAHVDRQVISFRPGARLAGRMRYLPDETGRKPHVQHRSQEVSKGPRSRRFGLRSAS